MAYADLLLALKGKRLSFVFSPDGTLISASAAPHCGDKTLVTHLKIVAAAMFDEGVFETNLTL